MPEGDLTKLASSTVVEDNIKTIRVMSIKMPIINSTSADSVSAEQEIFIDDGYDTSETKSQKTTLSESTSATSFTDRTTNGDEKLHENGNTEIETSENTNPKISNPTTKTKRKKKHKSKKASRQQFDHSTEIIIDQVVNDDKNPEISNTTSSKMNENAEAGAGDEIIIDQTKPVPAKRKSKPSPEHSTKDKTITNDVQVDAKVASNENIEVKIDAKDTPDKTESKKKKKITKNNKINIAQNEEINSKEILIDKTTTEDEPKEVVEKTVEEKVSNSKKSDTLPETSKAKVVNKPKSVGSPQHSKASLENSSIPEEDEESLKPKSLDVGRTYENVNSLTTTPSTSSLRSVSSDKTDKPKKKMKSFFLGGKRRTEALSNLGSSSVAKQPSPRRLFGIYTAVRTATSNYISMNTAELNVLLNKKKETGRTAHSYEIQKKIKRLERLIKALHYHVSQLDNLYEEYNVESRYKEGAEKLRSALHSSPVSSRTSRSSLMVAKADLACSVENMCQIERDFTELMGSFKLEMKGLLGFARLKAGDSYEVHFKYGAQKWKIRGSVKSAFDQEWDQTEHTIQPLLTDFISIKLMEVKLLGKLACVGNVSCETEDLFSAEPQDLAVNLNDTGSLKLGFRVTWSPFDFTDGASTLRHDSLRGRTRSFADQVPNNGSKESTSPRARPMSAMFLSYNFSNNNNLHQPDSGMSLDDVEIDAQSLAITEQDGKSVIEDEEVVREVQTKVAKFEEPVQNEPIMTGHRMEEEAFLTKLRDNAQAAMEAKKEDVPELADLQEIEASIAHARDISTQLLAAAESTNQMLDDYRGTKPQLQHLENVILELLERLKKSASLQGYYVSREEEKAIDNFTFLDSQTEDNFSIKDSELNAGDDYIVKYTPELITSGNVVTDEALIPHLNIVQKLLKDVGSFRPMEVKEVIAIDRLAKQAFIMESILELGKEKVHPELEDVPDLYHNRTLLELWRSCCDGRDRLCVKAKTLRLELESEFGREVSRRHPDVAKKVFPELVHRIMYRPGKAKMDDLQVTVFQLSNFVDDSIIENEGDDLGKIIDKLALELFITQTLQSGKQQLVLIAIKRVSSLLALRSSNLIALSHLLLDKDQKVCTAAAAHIMDMSTEKVLRQKALVAYAELLETHNKRDRQCACVALGFLGAKECIPQLTYLSASDTKEDVREAARHSLASFGDEGKIAIEHANSSLSVQTMTHQVSLKNHARMGVAL